MSVRCLRVVLMLPLCCFCSGLFNSIEMFSAGKGGTIAAGMIMIIIGLLFAAVAVANAVALVRVSFQPKIKLVRCLNTPKPQMEKIILFQPHCEEDRCLLGEGNDLGMTDGSRRQGKPGIG